MEASDYVKLCGRRDDLLQEMEKSVYLAHQVKVFCQVFEGNILWYLLFLHFSCSWRKEKIMFIVDLPAVKPHCLSINS